MKFELIKKYYPWLAVVLFFLSYIMWFPASWMITDSYSYALQALAFAQKDIALMNIDYFTGIATPFNISPYNLGTSSFHALFVFFFGIHGFFISPLIAALASILLLYFSLKNLDYSTNGIAVLLLSPAFLFFSRSLMSCMPSLLIISMFFYCFSRSHESKINIFLIGIISTLSIWFRETNFIILIPFLIILVKSDIGRLKTLIPGMLLGLSPKLISSYVVYGKWWFMSASEGFSINSIVQNFPVYACILLILIPLSIVIIVLYKEKWKVAFWISYLSFVIIYLAYNYTAVPFSGFVKGSLLTSRFMIPLLPLIAIAAGSFFIKYPLLNKFASSFLIPVSLLIIPLSQFATKKLFYPHEKVGIEMFEKYHDKPVLFDQSGYTNIIRYVNPVLGEYSKKGDINLLGNKSYTDLVVEKNETVYIMVSVSTGNEEKKLRTEKIKNIIDIDKHEYIETFQIDNDNWIEIYQFK